MSSIQKNMTIDASHMINISNSGICLTTLKTLPFIGWSAKHVYLLKKNYKMRNQKRLEIVKHYDYEIKYHIKKVNIIANAQK